MTLEKKISKSLETALSLRAESTRAAYKSIWKEWLAFLKCEGGDPRIVDIGPDQINQFISELKGRGVAATSVNTKLATLRSLYAALFEDGLVEMNPFASKRFFQAKDVESAHTQAYSPEEVTKILKASSANPCDHAFFSVLFNCGMRVKDLLDLQRKDVVRHQGEVLLKIADSKTGTRRSLPLSKWAEAALEAHLAESKPSHDARVFPFVYSTAYEKMKKYCGIAGLECYGLHAARATVVTQLLKGGFDYGKVASVTGHASLSTINIYDRRRTSLADNPARLLKYK